MMNSHICSFRIEINSRVGENDKDPIMYTVLALYKIVMFQIRNP